MDANRSPYVRVQAQLIDPLTERELDMLELAGRGLSIKGAAQALGIAPGTARWHLKNSYRKLGASSREEALRKARAENLLESVLVCRVCACAIAAQPRQAASHNSGRFVARAEADMGPRFRGPDLSGRHEHAARRPNT